MRRKDPNSLNKREKAILKYIEKQIKTIRLWQLSLVGIKRNIIYLFYH